MLAFLQKHSAVTRVGLVTILVYFSSSLLGTYRTLFFYDIGLSAAQIGIISAAGPIATLAFQTLWGRWGDRYGRKPMLCISLLGMGSVALLYLVNRDFLFVLGVTVLSTLFVIGTNPLADSVGIDFCVRNGYAYGPVRLLGTIGYFLAPLVWGWLFDRSIAMVFPIYAFTSFVTALCTLLLPRDQKREAHKREKMDYSLLPRMKDPVVLFALAVSLGMSLGGCVVGYFSVMARDLGMSTSTISILSSVSTFSEIPALLLIDKLMKRFGRKKLMVTGLFFNALRMFLYFLGARCSAPAAMLSLFVAAKAMQSVTFIPSAFCCMNLMYSRFPNHLKASAQTLISLMQSGISGVLGSLAGGFLTDRLGPGNAFLVMTFFCLVLAVGIGCFALYLKRHPAPLPADVEAA